MTRNADDRRDALAELLAIVASVEDADDAIQRGLVFTAEAVAAEFCAIVRHGSVAGAHGFRAADVPLLALVDIAEGRATTFEYGGFSDFHCVAVPIEDDYGSHLVVIRIKDTFSEDERQLLHAMGRVLTLSVRMLRRQTLRSEERRVGKECRSRWGR